MKCNIIKQGVVYRATETPFRYQAWPSVCRDEQGRLYAVCSGHRASHVCPFGMNLMFVSPDGGEHWSCPIIINDTWMDDRDAGITYLGQGRLLQTYFHHPVSFYLGEREWMRRDADCYSCGTVMGMLDSYPAYTPEMDTPGSFIRLSDNYGMSWSAPVQVPVTAPHGPVRTASGRLLYLGKEFWSDRSEKGEILLFESPDSGKSWEFISQIPRPEGCEPCNLHEPHLAELPDGRLVAGIRVEGIGPQFTIYFSASTDGGRSWSRPRSSGISGSPPHLLVLSDGVLLCTYGRRELQNDNPCGIRAVVSRDGFESFGPELVLSESPSADLGYPATVELDDGALVTVYYQRVGEDTRTSILYTKWRL